MGRIVGGNDETRLFDLEEIPRQKKAKDVSVPRDVMTHTREFGTWTFSKLEVLSAYFRMYRRVAGGGTYIDAFAGSGYARIGDSEVMGSPLRAITSGAFRHVHLFESDQAKHKQLSTAIASLDRHRCEVALHPPCDANQGIPALLDSGEVSLDRPCFAFLDPNSTQLDWATVESLANYKDYAPTKSGSSLGGSINCKVELWVLVNTHQALNRLLPRDRAKYEVPTHATVLDRVMGDRDAWWDIWQGAPGNLATRYAERLRDVLGYGWSHPQLVNDPQSHRPQYHMVHASDHPNAHTLMRSAKKSRMQDQSSLPGLGTRPQEPKKK